MEAITEPLRSMYEFLDRPVPVMKLLGREGLLALVILLAGLFTFELIYWLAILVLYLADSISYASYKRQYTVLAYPILAILPVTMLCALGPVRFCIVTLPLLFCLGFGHPRFLQGRPAQYALEKDPIEPIESENTGQRVRPLTSKEDFLTTSTRRHEESASGRPRVPRWLVEIGVCGCGAAFLHWGMGCDRYGIFKLVLVYTSYYVVKVHSDEFIGPRGKLRPALDPYIGRLLPDEEDEGQGSDAQSADRPPRSKTKWLVGGLVNFGLMFTLQASTRSLCDWDRSTV